MRLASLVTLAVVFGVPAAAQERELSAFAWLAGGRRIGRGSRLGITSGLRGRAVRCRVTASNGAGSRSAASPPVLVR